MSWKLLALCGAFLALSGCTLGPDFMRPKTEANAAETFINAPENSENAADTQAWWSRIDDDHIDSYVDRLLSQNLSLAEANARVRQAYENVRIQTGAYVPTIGANASASRSFNPISTQNSFLGNDRQFITSYDTEINTSWEIDLFGRITRSVESARATYEAQLYDREALKQSLIAQLIDRRAAVAANRRLLELAKQNANNRKTIYELVKRRYNLGTGSTTISDVYLAEENLSTVSADVFLFERLLNEESYRLDVLLGQKPGSTNAREGFFPMLPEPEAAPTCLPAQLLDRRPDLRSSELRLAAANADIGVAIADLYPSLSLSGAIGFSDEVTNNLFTAQRLAGSILGSISLRLFEGGRLRANIKLQEAEAEELSAAYANSVLEAMREVETSLDADRKLDLEYKQALRSAESLRKAEKATEKRYKRGIETLRNYLETQQRRYAAEQSLISKQLDIWNNRTNLYLALGGDWFGYNQTDMSECQKEVRYE